MIEAYTGLPGSGKSLNAVRQMLKATERGIPCFANFHSRSNLWQYVLFDDIKYIERGLVILDEAHMMFSARNWSKTTQEQLGLFQQHRKLGIDLIWIAQSASRVDVALRELTAFEWQHRRVGSVVIAKKTDPIESETKKKPLGRQVFWINSVLTSHYWTEERIGDINGNGAGFGRWGRAEHGPPPNFVRARIGDRIWFGPMTNLDCGVPWDELHAVYRDVYGRFTVVDDGGFTRHEAYDVVETLQQLKDGFFEHRPKPEKRDRY